MKQEHRLDTTGLLQGESSGEVIVQILVKELLFLIYFGIVMKEGVYASMLFQMKNGQWLFESLKMYTETFAEVWTTFGLYFLRQLINT